jgi:hypothetical protein
MVLNAFPCDSQHFMFLLNEDFAADIMNYMIFCRTGRGEIMVYWVKEKAKFSV